MQSLESALNHLPALHPGFSVCPHAPHINIAVLLLCAELPLFVEKNNRSSQEESLDVSRCWHAEVRGWRDGRECIEMGLVLSSECGEEGTGQQDDGEQI